MKELVSLVILELPTRKRSMSAKRGVMKTKVAIQSPGVLKGAAG